MEHNLTLWSDEALETRADELEDLQPRTMTEAVYSTQYLRTTARWCGCDPDCPLDSSAHIDAELSKR